jgi:hypothetical protein
MSSLLMRIVDGQFTLSSFEGARDGVLARSRAPSGDATIYPDSSPRYMP